MGNEPVVPSKGEESAKDKPPVQTGHVDFQTETTVFSQCAAFLWLLFKFIFDVLTFLLPNPRRISRRPPKQHHRYEELEMDQMRNVLLMVLGPPTPFHENLDKSAPGSMKLFQYTELPTPRHIRLLKKTNSMSGKMIFEIVCLSLEDAVDDFVAVSYCWGTEPPSKLLPLLDGSQIPVTANVEALLTHIFRGDRDTNIWIDAVCINQSNNSEKAQQVQMMKDIYRSAHQVSVWLGHGMPKIERQDRGHHSSDSDDSDEDNESGSDSDSDTGSDGSSDGSSDERKDGEIDGASHLVVCCDSGDEGDEVGNEDPNEDVDEVIDDDEDSEFFPDFFVELMAADRGRPLDLAFFLEGCLKLRGVLNSPWWRRVWVIQEVSYARSVRFHYGRLVFSFAFLSGLFRKIKEHSGRWLFEEEDDETGRRGTVFDRVNRDMLLNVFRRVRVSVLTDEFFPLREMYNLSYSFKATDPRDRIFALLGVVDEASHGRCIVPDYESGTRDVFIHAMTAITCNTLDFSLLGYAGLATSRARYNDGEHAGLPLPSWVPDFAAFPGVLLNLGSARGDFYKASTARRPVLAKKGAICLAKADLDAPGKDEEDGHGPIQHGVPYPLLRQGNARCPAKHYDTLTVQGTMADTIIACGIEFHGDNDETALGAWETIDSVLTFFEDGLRMIRKLGTYPTREKAEEVLFRTIFANNSRDWFQPKKLGWLSGFKFKKLLRALRAEADAGRGHESLVGHSREKPSNALERLGASFTTIPVTRAGCGRKLFSTRRGYVGLASNGVMVGDEVWLINGAAVPFISRKCMVAADDDGAVVREFICEAYVHGIMNGEAFSFKDIKEGPLVFI